MAKQIELCILHSFLLYLFLVPDTYCQHVSGRVFDSSDGEALSGAIIRAVNKKGETLSYVITDKDGGFELVVQSSAIELVASSLGYEELRYPSPFETRYQIAMTAKKEKLDEAIVKARKVVTIGDTTQYNLNALKSREDIVLGDVLKRIPGVELTSTGHIKVDGKDLGNFYVNGKDFLSSNYNEITKNLNVHSVKKVEIIRNHQAIKMLQGLEESDRTAVNILLENGYKGKINWHGAGSAGLAAEKPIITGAGNLSAIYLDDGRASILVGDVDSEGKALKENTFDFHQLTDGNKKTIRQHISPQTVSSPLDAKRSLFNQSVYSRVVNTSALSSTSSLSSSLSYSWDRRESQMNNRSLYDNIGDTDFCMDTHENRIEKGDKFTGSLIYKNNSSKHYVYNRLFADIGSSAGETDVSGDIERLQQTRGKRWDIDNDLTYSFRTNNRKTLSINTYTQFSHFDERLDVKSADISQTVVSDVLFEILSIKGLNRTSKGWKWSMEPKLDWTYYRRNNILVGIDDGLIPGSFEGSFDVQHITTGIDGELAYSKKSFQWTLGGFLHYDHIGVDNKRFDLLYPDLKTKFKYFTGKWELSIQGGINKNMTPEVQNLGTTLIMTDYCHIFRAQDSLFKLPKRFISGELFYRAPLSGWHFRLSSLFSSSRRTLNGRDLIDKYIINYETSETVGDHMMNSYVEITKALMGINGKVSFRLTHSILDSQFRQNNATVNYFAHSIIPYFDLTTVPVRFWNITAEAYWASYNIEVKGLTTTSNSNLKLNLTNSFYPAARVTIGADTDLLYMSAINTKVMLADLFLHWKSAKGFRLKIMANNLLNHKSFTYKSVSPLLISHTSYKIRPLTLLVGIDLVL